MTHSFPTRLSSELGTRLGGAMGGRPETFAGLTGMGDLIATCTSPLSRNRHVGVELGKGRPIDEIIAGMNMVADGVKSAPTVMALADKYGLDMPKEMGSTHVRTHITNAHLFCTLLLENKKTIT